MMREEVGESGQFPPFRNFPTSSAVHKWHNHFISPLVLV
jgi:hypothetical protein